MRSRRSTRATDGAGGRSGPRLLPLPSRGLPHLLGTRRLYLANAFHSTPLVGPTRRLGQQSLTLRFCNAGCFPLSQHSSPPIRHRLRPRRRGLAATIRGARPALRRRSRASRPPCAADRRGGKRPWPPAALPADRIIIPTSSIRRLCPPWRTGVQLVWVGSSALCAEMVGFSPTKSGDNCRQSDSSLFAIDSSRSDICRSTRVRGRSGRRPRRLRRRISASRGIRTTTGAGASAASSCCNTWLRACRSLLTRLEYIGTWSVMGNPAFSPNRKATGSTRFGPWPGSRNCVGRWGRPGGGRSNSSFPSNAGRTNGWNS